MHRSSILFVLLCLHCGGQAKTGPTDETPATAEPTEAPAADTSEPAASPEAAETEAPSSEASAPAAPAATSSRPECEKLSKSDCKVRQGCAWSDKQKCVDFHEGM
jgi:hypothetical protein